MAVLKKRSNFLESEEGLLVRKRLEHMLQDTTFNTEAVYNANTSQYPDNVMSFVEKHLQYLNDHPKLDAHMYLANLQLKTRIRR